MSDSKSLMPMIFIGHGSPENVLNDNTWTQSLRDIGKKIPKPEAILLISAHWQTQSLKITSNPAPDLIFDFFGFPQPLYSVRYPCQGQPELSAKLEKLLSEFQPQLDITRGFDHGVWTALCHLYPDADVPVVQISLSAKLGFEQNFKLGQKLTELREQNILIVGSGNIVHNLRQLMQITSPPHDWAIEFDEWVKDKITSHNYQSLIKVNHELKQIFDLAHPTPDHFLPLIICCGAARETDSISYPYEGFQYSSISMRNVLWR